MRNYYGYFLLLLAIVAGTQLSCDRNDTQFVPPSQQLPANMAPVANAGPDLGSVRTTDSVELKGSGADADGSIVSYRWGITAYYSQQSREVSFSYPAAVVKLASLQEGTYWCRLTVTDNGGLTATDEMVFQV